MAYNIKGIGRTSALWSEGINDVSLAKFIMGVGNRNNGPGPPPVRSVYNWSPNLAKSLQVVGWKYGLINAVPYKSSCVYRRDTYGQFRDMLEQRPYARYFQPSDYGQDEVVSEYPDNIEASTVYPIEIEFKSRGGLIKVDPVQTNSQNLSQFATSSVPYFDIFVRPDAGKQRPDIWPDGETETEITI